MKLCALFIIWDEFEMTSLANKAIHSAIDGTIIVYSRLSNSGEESRLEEFGFWYGKSVFTIPFPVDLSLTRRENETNKRNFGLNIAREHGYTHFLMLDSDEFYTPEDIELGKRMIGDNAGLVCKSILYFKTPEISIADHTLVPFIHKLTPYLKCGRYPDYPYSVWDGRLSIDPTRQMNITEGINYAPVTMHHMSGIRRDIRKKIRNSSGEKMKQFSNAYLEDYKNAAPGYKSRYYGKVMEKADNLFNLPEMIDPTI